MSLPLADYFIDLVGEGEVERLAVLQGLLEALEGALGQALLLLGGTEDVRAEDLGVGLGEVGRPESSTVRAPLRGEDVRMAGSRDGHGRNLIRARGAVVVQVDKPEAEIFATLPTTRGGRPPTLLPCSAPRRTPCGSSSRPAS